MCVCVRERERERDCLIELRTLKASGGRNDHFLSLWLCTRKVEREKWKKGKD